MNVRFLSSVAAVAVSLGLIGVAAPASAQADTEVDVAFNVGVFSDYVYRGYSQTNEDPAIQGGMDLTAGNFYAGVWASNVDFGDDTDAEVDFYAGYRTEVQGFAVDGGVIAYSYVNAPSFTDYNYTEFKLAASRAVGPATVGAAVFYSPSYLNEQTLYYEINGSFSPMDKLTLSGAVGLQTYEDSDEYTTWNLGATYALTDNLGVDVRYHDTDVDNVQNAEDRVVASLKVMF